MDLEFFKDKNVLVMGLGSFGGGLDSAEFAARAGAKVIVTDLTDADKLKDSIKNLREFPNIHFHLGYHDEKDFINTDIVIANPAVRPDNELLNCAQQNGAFVTSQINIFFEHCPTRIIGITGANGKSTSTALTAYLLEKAGDKCPDKQYKKVWLGGNIGNRQLLTIIDQISADDLVVLELSSYQIEQLAWIEKGPSVSLLTNLTPNHLDRYGTFEKYCTSKKGIFDYQNCDVANPAISIFNAQDEIAAQWYKNYSSQAGRKCLSFSTDDVTDDIAGRFALPGVANLSNLAAAMAVCRQFGITERAITQVIDGFKALPHRLELIAQIKGAKWYNDSKATTPEGTMVALNAFENTILIAGGYDKGISFDELGEIIAQKAKGVILIGQTAQKIASAVLRALPKTSQTPVIITNTLAKAIDAAAKMAGKDDVVVFSPACASYDMFDNYVHRGNEFGRLVRGVCR